MINSVKRLTEVYENRTCSLTSIHVPSYGVTKKRNCTLAVSNTYDGIQIGI